MNNPNRLGSSSHLREHFLQHGAIFLNATLTGLYDRTSSDIFYEQTLLTLKHVVAIKDQITDSTETQFQPSQTNDLGISLIELKTDFKLFDLLCRACRVYLLEYRTNVSAIAFGVNERTLSLVTSDSFRITELSSV